MKHRGSVVEKCRLSPIADDGRDGVARPPKAGDIRITGAGDLPGGFVEDIEIVAEAAGIGSGVCAQSVNEMTFFTAIGGNHFEDFGLEGRQRHLWSSCAHRHAAFPPFFRRYPITCRTSADVSMTAFGSQNQKQLA